MAIELYDGPSGPAYVQLTDVLINGKAELRACGSAPKIDKSTYGKLERLSLSSGATIDYRRDGTLALTKDGQTTCVVPSNLRYEKNTALTPAQLAEQVALRGRVVTVAPGTSDQPPALKPGVRIVIVDEPSVEFAEYLRADRGSTIALWRDYVSRYPSAPHTAAAKQALGSLLVKDGEESLATYRKTSSGSSPSYAELGNARMKSDQALALVASDPAATQLRAEVQTELVRLTETAHSELQTYQEALKAHQSGYSHLLLARKLAEAATTVDPNYARVAVLQTETHKELAKIEASLHAAEAFESSREFDKALASVAEYVAFAGEEPRIAAIVSAAYKYHFNRGQELATAQNWPGAVAEFQQAAAVQKTEEVGRALKAAEGELEKGQNQRAAMEALQQSQDFAEQHRYIQAYEVLANLPEASRSLVSDDMEKLVPLYIQSALQTAKELKQAHDPIHGLADELGIQRAYELLQRAYELSDDASLKDKMATLADKLSEYYLAQAKRQLNKPLGSGVGLGWFYLDKALPYKGSNLDSVRDEMTKAASAYQLRSRLSIRVVFRDQTSRRDSGGFADYLADALATGMESGGLLVKVIRPTDPASLEPNFQLIGDVLEHRRIVVPTIEPMDSKYRAGQQERPNEQWMKANREYEAALLELQSAQKALAGAKKKEIAEAKQRVSEVQKKVEQTHSRLDSVNRTVAIDIIQPYTYTRRSIDLGAVVQVQYRIADFSGAPVVEMVPILCDAHKTFTVLENVKPEDTEGVKAQGTIPDEIQFLTDVENDARDKLIKGVCARVAELPTKILELARKKKADGDAESAAESYILFLNSTTAVQSSTQRQEAANFLKEQFNIRSTSNASF